MPRCSVCRQDLPAEQLVGCSECGRRYCKECAKKDPSMRALGICPDCEEAWQDEDDM